MDWFLYDNGLRHERVNVVGGRLASLLSPVLFNISIELQRLIQKFKDTPMEV